MMSRYIVIGRSSTPSGGQVGSRAAEPLSVTRAAGQAPRRPLGDASGRAGAAETLSADASGGAEALSVTEVAPLGGDHRGAAGVGGCDDLLVAHGAARLDDRADARVDRELRAVGEGEVGV